MKRKKILIAIVVIITVGIIYVLSNIILDPLQKSLLTIPKNRSFYYYKNEKIELIKKVGREGVYFVTKNDLTSKIIINRELFINFYPNINDDQINSIFRTESLVVVEKNDWLGKNYLVKTTDNSKFVDALQMSNYLYETYSNLVEYATPNREMHILAPLP